MIVAIILGLLAGIVLGFGFGTVFFALIQDSIDFGWKTGVKISSGVLTGDFLLVSAAFVGTYFLPTIPNFGFYARIIGAILLIALGISGFFNKNKQPKPKGKTKFGNYLYYFTKGFLLNVLNPSNFLSWLFVSATLKTYNFTFQEEIVFLITCMFSIFVTEVLIAFYSHRLKGKFTPKTITKFKVATSILFFGVAGKLLLDVFKN